MEEVEDITIPVDILEEVVEEVIALLKLSVIASPLHSGHTLAAELTPHQDLYSGRANSNVTNSK